jgi:Protein of unknown function VcgC/VcgE (DUF2780)
MQRRHFLVAFGIATISAPLLHAQNPINTDALKSSVMGSGSNALLGMLTSKLGVTQNQAEGGVGSILKLAQEKLVKGDFDQVAAVIPGASKYLDKAKSLGAFTGNLDNVAGLNGALGKLGISPDTAARFIPAVTDFVGKAGGSKVGGLLKSVLM